MNFIKKLYFIFFKCFYIDVESAIKEYNRKHPLNPIKTRGDYIKCIIKS